MKKGANFVDYSDISNQVTVLKPNVVSKLPSTNLTKRNSLIEQNQNINAQLTKLVESVNELNTGKIYTFIVDYLNKTKKLIQLSITNEATKCHYASYNLLKSAVTTLIDCISEVEVRLNPSQKNKIVTQLNIIKEFINDLNINSQQINQTNLVEANSSPKNSDNNSSSEDYPKPSDPNALNDWILSDFNLLSNDFNNELTFICGNLFDLNFTYKMSRILNNKCFIVKLRHPMKKIDQSSTSDDLNASQEENDEFVVKVSHFLMY